MRKRNVMVIMVLCVTILVLFCLLFEKKQVVMGSGMVRYVGDDYVIVACADQKEYSFKTNQKYEVGDRLSFSISKGFFGKDVIGKDVLEEKQNVSFVIQDIVQDVSIVEEGSMVVGVENTSEDLTVVEENSTDGVMLFANQLEEEIDRSGTFTESIRAGFVTLVDFLFYDGVIGGKKFSELTDMAKLQVLKSGLSIDQKLERKFPHYKEEVKDTGGRIFTNMKARVVEIYLDIVARVCNNREDVCVSAKEGLGEIKENFSLTWNFIKEISGVGVKKLKSWYEVWRES